MAKFSQAKWAGPVPNMTPHGMVRPIMGLVLHIEVGTEAGTNSAFHNRNFQASAHFGNPKTGPLDQWVDTNDKAWAESQGNSRWISVENEGMPGDALTASQLENIAQLYAWLHQTEGVPFSKTDSPAQRGLGWHGMGGAAWGGHTNCPGEPIKNQRDAILIRAQQIVGQSVQPPKGPTVPVFNPPMKDVTSGKERLQGGAYLLEGNGGVTTIGSAPFCGSNFGQPGRHIDILPTPSGQGYWVLKEDGGIVTFGDAQFEGCTFGKPYWLQHKAIRLEAHTRSNGLQSYIIVAENGDEFGHEGF